MTSNNLEAIELLKTCVERLQDQGFSSHGNTVSELNKAIDLLQADEDIEVKEHACLCKEDNCPNCEGTLIHAKVVGYRHQVKLESENLASRELAQDSKSNNKDTDNE